jgi:hypothetical protein
MDRWTGKGVGGDLDGPRYNAKLNGQDDPGDSTVPGRSGVAPKSSAKFFATMQGFGHQDAYGDNTVQAVTLYSVIRLAAQATPLA